ncbi:MAG: hypothetical protein JXR88_07565 [Clostridia bacterium]|nr:hypothetical protein [Clostridia bacterium]
MNVKLEQKLIDYMHDHHKNVIALTLKQEDTSGSELQVKYPKVKYHKPNDEEHFQKFQIEDITIYVENDIPTLEDQLYFVDEKLFNIHRCQVIGVDVNKLNEPNFHTEH